MVKRKRFPHVFTILNSFVMVALTIIFFYPIWHTLVLSFSTPEYASSLGIKIFPPQITFDSYKAVFATKSIYVGYINTLYRTIIGTSLTVFVTYCAGCALARRDLPFCRTITFFIVVTMFFSGGLIPTFLTIKSYNLIDTRWALILPVLTSAWNILITRNYIRSLPIELEEAAVVDGAHPLQTVFKVMLPLSMPVIAVLTLWSAVGHWNAWFDALLYCGSESKIVLQLVLRRLLIDAQAESSILQSTLAQSTSQTIKCATIIVAILPILCVYPFVQKHFTKGVTLGAVKG